MSMKVGIDLTEIKRFLSPSEHFLEVVLSSSERILYDAACEKASFLAGLWAAKEAYLKAKGTGLSGLPLKEIVLEHDELGCPHLFAEKEEFPVSISHDGGYAVAVVIIP